MEQKTKFSFIFLLIFLFVLIFPVHGEIVSNEDKCSNCKYFVLFYYGTRTDNNSLTQIKSELESNGYTCSEIQEDNFFGDYFTITVNSHTVYVTNQFLIEKKNYSDYDKARNFVTGNDLTNVNNDFNTIKQASSLDYTFNEDERLFLGFTCDDYIHGYCGESYGSHHGSGSSYAIAEIEYSPLNVSNGWYFSYSKVWKDAQSGSHTASQKIRYYYQTSSYDEAYSWSGSTSMSGVVKYLEDNIINNDYRNYLQYSGNNALWVRTGIDNTVPDPFFYFWSKAITVLLGNSENIQHSIDYNRNSYSFVEEVIYYKNLDIPKAPEITIYKPKENANYTQGDTILCHILTNDEENDLIKVEYYLNEETEPFRTVNSENGYAINDYFYLTDYFNYSTLTIGEHTLKVKAYSENLNSEASVNFNVVEKEVIKPNILIYSPENKDYSTNTVDIHFLAWDTDGNITKIKVYVDDNLVDEKTPNLESYNYYNTITLENGEHELFVDVYDNDEAYTYAHVSFSILAKPEINIVLPL